jgi:hypothetical protein
LSKTYYEKLKTPNLTKNRNKNHHIIISYTLGHRLIHAKRRGGLTEINSEAQKIFFQAENIYKTYVNSNDMREHNINTQKMASELMLDPMVVSSYGNIIDASCLSVDIEIKENVLEKLLTLYLKVRAFSTAKDIVSKHRIEKKSKKTKALRKDLKNKSSDDQKKTK